MTYSYIIGEEGDVLKDGPLSIKCSVVNEKTYISPYTITVNGSYTLNATYSKGNLNGPFSSNYKTTLDGYIIVSKDAVSVGSTMTGNFANGVPNGAFKVTRKGDLPTTLTANFKNGKLVGAFSCSMTDEDSYRQKYSGTLTQTGKPTGVWKVNDGRTTIGELTREFSNGVLISEVSKKKATKPAISALARKYANGELTEEQLFEQGCVIRTAKMELGDFVRIAILRDAAVDFKELGGYDFSEPNHIEYKWLKETATMTDAGVQKLVSGIRQFIIDDWRSILGEMVSSSEYDEGIKYGCIETDERGRMYVQMGKWQNNGYAKGGFEEHEDNVYLSPKQSEYVEQQAYQAILESVCSLKDLAIAHYKERHDSENVQLCESYFRDGKNSTLFNTPRDIEKTRNALGEVYDEVIRQGIQPLPMDANITAAPYGDRKIKYVHIESITEYKQMLDELDVVLKDVAEKNAVSLKEYFVKFYENRNPKIAKYLKEGDVSGLLPDNISYVKQGMMMDYENLNRRIQECPFAESLVSYGSTYIKKDSFAEYQKMLDELDATLKDAVVKNAVSLKEYFVEFYENRNPKIAKYLKEGDVSGLLPDNISYVKQGMMRDYENLNRRIQECPFAESLVSYGSIYIKKDSFAEYQKMLDEFEARVTIESVSKLIAKVFDYMVAERTAFGICYGECENYFYSTSGHEYWRSELESALKKFGRQFVGYEIISADNTTVECKLTFLGKKKVVGTWQITLEHKNGKLCVESFDINKATKLEE